MASNVFRTTSGAEFRFKPFLKSELAESFQHTLVHDGRSFIAAIAAPEHEAALAFQQWQGTASCQDHVELPIVIMNTGTFATQFQDLPNPVMAYINSMRVLGHPCLDHVVWMSRS